MEGVGDKVGVYVVLLNIMWTRRSHSSCLKISKGRKGLY